MKRYLLFGYSQYYPGGGSGDVIESFDSMDEVKSYLKLSSTKQDFYEVLDLDERKWIDVTDSELDKLPGIALFRFLKE